VYSYTSAAPAASPDNMAIAQLIKGLDIDTDKGLTTAEAHSRPSRGDVPPKTGIRRS
jgi:hypothetical protein